MSNVTLKDIYQVVQRVEDKIDARMQKVESRVDILEDFRGKALGIMSVVTFVASAIFTWAWQKITGKA